MRSLLLLILTLALHAPLSGCTPGSPHGAADYFEGKALQLAIATENGDEEAIGHLIKDEDVDAAKTFSRRDGIPLIAWPLRAKNLDGLKAMLENGADPNARLVQQMNGEEIHFNNAMVYAAKMDDPRFLELLCGTTAIQIHATQTPRRFCFRPSSVGINGRTCSCSWSAAQTSMRPISAPQTRY